MERIATVKFIASKKSQTRGGMSAILKYCSQDKKTIHNDKKLVSGVNVVAESSFSEMMNTKNQYSKTGGRMFYHLIQSFHPDEKITPETAHEIALKLAGEMFKGYEVQVATHSDTEHIHSHFVINSVSFETGKKYHPDKEEINRIRDCSDKLCKEYGLSVLKSREAKVKQMSAREYRVADKGESWKLQLAITIDEAMKFAISKEHFISLMENEGYEVKWTDSRKNITYTTPNGMRCRDNKLHEEKYLKEIMENEFKNRKEITNGIKESSKNEFAKGSRRRAVYDDNGQKLEGSFVGVMHSNSDVRNAIQPVGNINQQGGDGKISESSSRNISANKYENTGNSGELQRKSQQCNREVLSEFETDQQGFIITGWKAEREIFRELWTISKENPENYELDFENRFSTYDTSDSLVVDSAYLIAGITNIFEDKPVEDATTIKKPKKERKHYYGEPKMRM